MTLHVVFSSKQADRNNYDFCLLPFSLKSSWFYKWGSSLQFLRVCVFMCICRYVCTCVRSCIYADVCACVCSCVYADECAHVSIRVYTQMCVHMWCVHVIYRCVCTCAHVHVYMQMYVYMRMQGIWIQFVIVVWQVFYILVHIPGPSFCVFGKYTCL